ncbi:hypothetical protein GWK47_028804 [Chionoecetes opilio]|uniref:Uncharacterized protein n=1 Tax=Chionoecetes opilio TaxID=41210 RepID=A0A8J4YKV8_CHIOP|nr:hypothetical protein GWK47_028804 [Chionoecetes opilio]
MCEATHKPPVLRPTSPPAVEKPVRPPPPLEKPETSKAKSPIPARHKKGPAPPPPAEEPPKEAQKPAQSDDETRKARRSSPVRSRMESTRSPSVSRRWSSREIINGHGYESSSYVPSLSTYGSTSSLYNGASLGNPGNSWSSPLSFLRDDVRGRYAGSSCGAASTTASSSYYGSRGERNRVVGTKAFGPLPHTRLYIVRRVGLSVGFEPTPPKRLEPKSSALDHSATLPHYFSHHNKFLKQE